MPNFDSLDALLEYHRFPFTLRGDQVEDVENNFVFDKAALFNEVGTGKTATGTAIALAWDREVNVVVVPPILLRQWYKWLKSLHDVGEPVIYRGTPAQRKEIDLRQYRWVLMTIQIFKKDQARLRKELPAERALLIDEAHSIKNPLSDNHRTVREFSTDANLLLMTGTPISSPHDAYAYVKLKTPNVYRTQTQFYNIHVEERDFFDNVAKWKNLEQMNRNLMLQASRRLSKEVLKLKDVNYIPIRYDLDPEHLRLYKELADEQLLLLPDGGKIDATSSGKLYNALQQIVVNWGHFSGDDEKVSKAFDLVDHVADEIDLANPESSKLIICTYYKMTSKAVTSYLEKYNAVAVYSDITPKQQEANLARFMDDPTCRVLVIQGGSGVGFNPQAVCWETLFLEEPIIPAHFVQVVGRTDRQGQLHTPNVRIGIAEGTIQNHLHERLLKKDELANDVQGGYEDLRKAIHGG